MRRIQTVVVIVFVALLLAMGGANPARAQQIRFAQITDPHLFDSTGKPTDNRPENERCLRWAIDEINRRNTAGPAYDFVVVTGDFGLEGVLKPLCKKTLDDLKDDPKQLNEELGKLLDPAANPAVKTAITNAAAVFATYINRSDVTRWFLVPGNNDLVEEMPATIECFHEFVKQVQAACGPVKEVMDFAPGDKGDPPAVFMQGTCLFAGFDDSSFKNNYSTKCRDDLEASQVKCLDRLKTSIQNGEEAVAKLRKKEPDAALSVFIFCHVPEIDDPYLATHKDLKGFLATSIRGSSANKADGPYAASAWTVDDKTIRVPWDELMKDPRVKRVFAGHFHSPARVSYEDDLKWARTTNEKRPATEQYPQESLDKLLICPPIAVKQQIAVKAEPARGFRDVTVDAKSGSVGRCNVVWAYDAAPTSKPTSLPSSTPPPPPPPPRQPVISAGRIAVLAVLLACAWVTFFIVNARMPDDARMDAKSATLIIALATIAAATMTLIVLVLLR